MVYIDNLLSPEVQKLWNDWELRIITIISMSLQIFLMVFATQRRTTKNMWLILLIGISLSLADWIAAYGVGLISSGQGNDSSSDDGSAVANQLVAFWAPFFLLHLSGADTITSPSLDDDCFLMIKQLVVLVSHILAIVFIFLKSFPNKLMAPTILVFVAGIFRNAQRVSPLILRSYGNFKASKGNSPASANNDDTKFSETYSEMMKANMPTEILRRPSPPKAKRLRPLLSRVPKSDGDISILEYGTLLYDSFKGFITNVTVASEDRRFYRDFFCCKTPKEAFKIIEVELNCMYEDLYTQSLRVHRTFFLFFPSFNMALLFVSIVIFIVVEKKKEWQKFDIVLTYILLIAAYTQESISHFRIKLSPRNYLKLKKYFLHYRAKLLDTLKLVVCASFPFSSKKPTISLTSTVDTKVSGKRRWSRSMCHINLLDWCLSHRSRPAILVDKFAAFFVHRHVVDVFRLHLSVSIQPVSEHVKEIIFEELKKKSAVAHNKDTAIKICSQRGDWALMESSLYNELKWSLGELNYGESLILWHIATELCYSDSGLNETQKIRRFCKILSDYMFYLLILKPKMVVSVAGDWNTVFHDTCAHARSFALTRSGNICKNIISEYGDMPTRRLRGHASGSVLVDAGVLAKQLQNLQAQQWKLMSQVWVEMLSYAAFHCDADVHAQQPSQGGELVTFVWLLMNHLGLGKQVME